MLGLLFHSNLMPFYFLLVIVFLGYLLFNNPLVLEFCAVNITQLSKIGISNNLKNNSTQQLQETVIC